VIRRSGGGSAAKVTIGGVVAVIITLVLIGLRVANTADRIMGKSVVDETVSIPADGVHDGGIEVKGTVSYTFTVTAHDGEVLMVFGQVRDFNNPTQEDFMRLMAGARKVARGGTEVMSGTISSGHYAWGIINPNEKSPVRVYVKFHGR
jgi:hypothetical protein